MQPIFPSFKPLPDLPAPNNNRPTHQTDQSSVPLTDSGGRMDRGNFDSLLDNFRAYLGGNNHIDNQTMQWIIQNLWNRQNAEMSENWAREDAYTAWQRSLASADYNAQLGLDTSLKGRQQLYDQLVSLGMSPAAAMQAISGSAGAGSAGAGASAGQAATQSIDGAANGGDTKADRINAGANVAQTVVNGLSEVAQAVSNIYSNVAQLKQNASQFDRQLAFDQYAFDTANFVAKGNAAAANSPEYKDMWSAMMDYVKISVPAEDALSPYSVMQYMNNDQSKLGVAMRRLYEDGRSKYGQYFDSQFYSNYGDMVRSIGGEMSVKLQMAQLENARLDRSIKQLNLDKLGVDYKWFCDQYSDYGLKRDALNSEALLRLRDDIFELQICTSPEMRALKKRQMLANEEYQALSSEIGKIIKGQYKDDYIDSEEYRSILNFGQYLSDLGIDGTSRSVVMGAKFGADLSDQAGRSVGRSIVENLKQRFADQQEFHLQWGNYNHVPDAYDYAGKRVVDGQLRNVWLAPDGRFFYKAAAGRVVYL